jgi:membrane protein YqaA with SNARE-associated domain
LVSTVATLAVLLGVLFGLAYFFRPALTRVGQWFVDHLGGPGVGLGYLIPDALTIPIPADLVASIALFGGMSFASVVLWGSLGSVVGGCLGWAVGRFLVWRIAALRARMDNDTRVVPFFKKRGGVVLALAALTPLPYSLACWTAGGIGMGFGNFLLISLLRIPRVAFYLWLVVQGVIETGVTAGGVG